MRLRAALLAVAALSVGGCGSSGSSGPPPAVSLDSTSQTYTAFSLSAHTITTTPDPSAFTFSGFTSGPVVKTKLIAAAGIKSVTFTATDATHGGLTYTFEAPNQIGAGQHDSTVQVFVCVDSGCTDQVVTYTISVAYVVDDTVRAVGTNGYTMTAVPVPQTTSIAGNDQQSTLFLGVAADAAAHPLSVAALDTASGALSFSAQPLGDNVVLAGDGASLYAWPTTTMGNPMVTITQVSLGTLTPGALQITLEGGIESVAAAPGAPQTLAVIYVYYGTLQIFDGTTPRPGMLTSATNQYASLQWLSSDSLYVLNQYFVTGTDYSPCSYPVQATGISAADETCSATLFPGPALPLSMTGIGFANGRGYTQLGPVVDPGSWATIANLTLPTAGTIEAAPLPDATLDRLFVIERTQSDTGCLLQSFTLSTLAPLASLALPVDGNGNCLDAGRGLVRFGANGLALNGGTAIVLISGALVSG